MDEHYQLTNANSLFRGEDRWLNRKDNLFFLNSRSNSAKSSREPREPFSGVKIVLASRGAFFTAWKFLSRAARAFLQREISSREPREPFYSMILALASRGSYFTGWYSFPRAAATFLQDEISSRELWACVLKEPQQDSMEIKKATFRSPFYL